MQSLLSEFQIYERGRAKAYLEKKGCMAECIEYAANVDVIRHGKTYTPTPDAGVTCIALPVYDGGDIVDIVAWSPTDPLKWYTRRGTDSVLGAYDLQQAIVYRTPLKVYPSPCQWLTHGMVGCVPLTTDSMSKFMGVIEIDTSHELYEKIIAQLQLSYPTPKLVKDGK